MFIQKVISSVDRLIDFPFSGRIVPEFDDDKIIEIIFHNYRIVYRIKSKFVEIITIIHGAKLLKS